MQGLGLGLTSESAPPDSTEALPLCLFWRISLSVYFGGISADAGGCTSRVVKSLGPVVPSFRTLSGRFTFTVRRHEFNKDSPLFGEPGLFSSPKLTDLYRKPSMSN